MSPDQIQLISTISQIVLSSAALISSVAIPLVIYHGQRRVSMLEYVRSMRDSWIEIDTAVIHDPRLMKLADEISDPASPDMTNEERTRKWFGYMFLNLAFADYLGGRYKLSHSGALNEVNRSLKNILRNKSVRSIVKAYPPDFRNVCAKIITAIEMEEQAQQQTKTVAP